MPLLGSRSHPRAAVTRRLFIEAFTAASFALKAQFERSSDEAPKELPLLERAARLEAVQRRLVGFKIKGDLEPSCALVDAASHRVERGVLRRVPWAELTRREAAGGR